MKKCLFLFIGVLFGLISCKNKINCPEFDEKILSWIPYQKNDVIELYSQSDDSTIEFLIESMVVNHKTDYERNTKCGRCNDDIFINNYDSDFYVEIYLYDRIAGHQSYKIIDTYFSTYSEVKNYLFESKEYDLVRVFETNDTQGTFRKLIVAEGIGIIGLVDSNGNSWVLKTSAPTKKPNIMINKTSC